MTVHNHNIDKTSLNADSHHHSDRLHLLCIELSFYSRAVQFCIYSTLVFSIFIVYAYLQVYFKMLDCKVHIVFCVIFPGISVPLEVLCQLWLVPDFRAIFLLQCSFFYGKMYTRRGACTKVKFPCISLVFNIENYKVF